MTDDFKVINIDPLTRQSDLGGIEKYYRVKIKTKGGIVDTVNIDEKDLTEEKAKPILLAKAQDLDKIKALRG